MLQLSVNTVNNQQQETGNKRARNNWEGKRRTCIVLFSHCRQSLPFEASQVMELGDRIPEQRN